MDGVEKRVFAADELAFGPDGLIPAIVQDAASGEVLMVGYMNRESLEKTLETGLTWFYSRSRGRLWQKGETSGHVQRVQEILTDCDQDALLVRVVQEGAGACHEGYRSCFHYGVAGAEPEKLAGRAFEPAAAYGVLGEVYEVIRSRKERPAEGSYTSYLFASGIDKILKKVGEESAEVLISGKGADRAALVAESADLLYHLLVLWVEAGISPADVWAELGRRRGGGGSEDKAPGK